MVIKHDDAHTKHRYMGKQDKKTEEDHGVQTPPPPQVIDPSSPPDKGRNEDYEKKKRERQNNEKWFCNMKEATLGQPLSFYLYAD